MIENCETNDIEKIYEYCEFGWAGGRELAVIISTDAPFPDVYQMYVQDFQRNQEMERGGIVKYNPKLDIVLRRNAARLNQQFIRAMEKLRQNPDFPLLKKMLKDLSTTGKRWFKNPQGKWEPEPDFIDSQEPPVLYSNGKEM